MSSLAYARGIETLETSKLGHVLIEMTLSGFFGLEENLVALRLTFSSSAIGKKTHRLAQVLRHGCALTDRFMSSTQCHQAARPSIVITQTTTLPVATEMQYIRYIHNRFPY